MTNKNWAESGEMTDKRTFFYFRKAIIFGLGLDEPS